MRPERGARPADIEGSPRHPGRGGVHGHLPEIGIGDSPDKIARLKVRIGQDVLDVVDGNGGHAARPEDSHVFIAGARENFIGDDFVQRRVVRHAGDVVLEPRIGDQILAPQPAREALVHGLGRGRDRDPLSVLRRVAVAGRGVLRKVSGSRVFFSVQGELRRVGADDGEERLVERQVDDLSFFASQRVPPVEREHGGGDAVEARRHVRDGDRGKQGRGVGKPVDRAETRGGLDQRSEPRPVAVGPILPPSRDAHDDEPGVDLVKRLGRKAPGLELARKEILGEDVRLPRQFFQYLLPGRFREVEGERFFPAPVDLPPRGRPRPKGVAPPRHLDFHHLGAGVGEEHAVKSPDDEAGQIEHFYAFERRGHRICPLR